MDELKKHIYNENNGLHYALVGDYYILDLKLLEENRPIGHYGRLHRKYLKQEHPARYSSLILTGKLWTYFADLNKQAEERFDLIIEQMKAAEGVTEEQKARNQLEWVGRMNNIRSRAEEIINSELIYI
ncbi:TnpV protein [Bacteroides acidifaciens]|uniref:TnpV protein n=1 Tax=Bacteroides acidifaciens TaxID=85831 RepID=UPI002431011B|nr:TnpV protein [Bacteroides acidifaciens]